MGPLNRNWSNGGTPIFLLCRIDGWLPWIVQIVVSKLRCLVGFLNAVIILLKSSGPQWLMCICLCGSHCLCGSSRGWEIGLIWLWTSYWGNSYVSVHCIIGICFILTHWRCSVWTGLTLAMFIVDLSNTLLCCPWCLFVLMFP